MGNGETGIGEGRPRNKQTKSTEWSSTAEGGESSQILGRGRSSVCLRVRLSVGVWAAAVVRVRSQAPILNDVFLSMSLIKSLADTDAAASEGEDEEEVVF